MITGEVKNKVDKIWTDIWTGGITNPLTVIEQLTYLMFIRLLDEREFENEQIEALTGRPVVRIFPQDDEGQAMRWSKFRFLNAEQIYQVIAQRVFPFIKKMNGGAKGNTAFARYMQSAMFMFPEENKQILQKVVTHMDELYEALDGRDMQGDLYEYMLSKIERAGINGQFRTPKHIREMMVGLVKPTPDDLICDRIVA